MPKTDALAPVAGALVPAEPKTPLAVVQDILGTIPQADTDPTERMAAFILDQPPENWDELWAGIPNFRDNVGKRFIVHAIRARESDFEGALNVYLIADVTWDPSGEKGLIACSSQVSMVQLLALYKSGRLPAFVEIVAKDKPTKAGFRPLHLRYLGGVKATLGDPGAVVSEQ